MRSIEDEIQSSIPAAYSSLLKQYGASTFKGRSENNPYVYFRSKALLPRHISANGLALFDFFYGSTQQTGPSGLRQQINFFRGRIPETMIPIAGNGGAGQICLGIKGNDLGKVFYWDMANEPLDEETYLEDYGEPMPDDAKRQNVYLIADSYNEFLDQLVFGDEETGINPNNC
jgi:SMI1-KNR4 cell-wall